MADKHQFYETPSEIASKMINEIIWDRRSPLIVVDSSAGQGAILDVLEGRYRYSGHVKLYAIEIDADRRFTLQGKGYAVIGSDFLTYSEPVKFNVAIMNPPFNQGVHHVLKGWEVIGDGGQVIALLNMKTLQNDYSAERKLLAELISKYGKVKPLNDCFRNAPRSTYVDVALVVLNKPAKEINFNFEAVNFEPDSVEAKEFASNPLAHTDKIANLIAQYKGAEKAILEREEAQSKLRFYLNGISHFVYSDDEKAPDPFPLMPSLNEQIMALKGRYWNTLFTRTNLGSRATSYFRHKFTEYATGQRSMAFSHENVREVLSMFFENREKIMLDCCADVFDSATSYHKENSIHTEGWVTNKGWRINKRIIMPNAIDHDRKWGRFSLDYRQKDFLHDLDRVLCWLCGKNVEEIETTAEALDLFCSKANSSNYQDPVYSTFFTMKIHKKGTLWLDFKDFKLLEDFNKAAAKQKQWLGGDGY